MAIQLVINKEWGLGKKRESEPGLVHRRGPLTDLVEEAVLKEFEAIAEAGGVLGRWRPGISAQDPGRIPGVRAPEARCFYPIVWRQHLPQPARQQGPSEARADPPTEKKSNLSSSDWPSLRAAQGRIRPMLKRLQQA